MKQKWKSLWEKHGSFLVYLFFGVFTTVVNYAVYLPLYNFLHISASVSHIIAWVVSVAIAFLTNKPFVFKSHDWSLRTVMPELRKFIGCRAGSGLIELAAIFLLVDQIGWDGNIVKLATSASVIILNYAGSKWLVFRKKA